MWGYEEFWISQTPGSFPGPEGRKLEFGPVGKLLNLSELQPLHPSSGGNGGASSSSLGMAGHFPLVPGDGGILPPRPWGWRDVWRKSRDTLAPCPAHSKCLMNVGCDDGGNGGGDGDGDRGDFCHIFKERKGNSWKGGVKWQGVHCGWRRSLGWGRRGPQGTTNQAKGFELVLTTTGRSQHSLISWDKKCS